jgi:hypothetical protein
MLAADPDERHISVHSFLTRDLKIERVPGRREVSFAPVATRVRDWCNERHRVLVVVSGQAQVGRLARLFENHDV